MTRTVLADAAALGVVMLAAAAPAPADIRIFKATAEGKGSYDRYDERWAFGDPVLQDAAKASFSWRATIPRVVFDSNGRLLPGAGPSDSSVTGSGRQDFVGFGRAGDQIVRNPGAVHGR
jgi:hypothetical protein